MEGIEKYVCAMFLEKVADFDCFVGIGMLSVGMLKGCLINIHRIRGCEEYVEYLESNVVRNRYG